MPSESEILPKEFLDKLRPVLGPLQLKNIITIL